MDKYKKEYPENKEMNEIKIVSCLDPNSKSTIYLFAKEFFLLSRFRKYYDWV